MNTTHMIQTMMTNAATSPPRFYIPRRMKMVPLASSAVGSGSGLYKYVIVVLGVLGREVRRPRLGLGRPVVLRDGRSARTRYTGYGS
jgi:hypothetical protein